MRGEIRIRKLRRVIEHTIKRFLVGVHDQRFAVMDAGTVVVKSALVVHTE